MIFKLRKTKRKEMIIYIGSGHMTGGCVTVHDNRLILQCPFATNRLAVTFFI